jgi:hypothetical protein
MKAEEQPAADAPEASESPEDEADSEEVTQLSTGETITLRDARAFMDYYCKRFGFGQPEISYETVAMRAGPSKWEAIMEVSMAAFVRYMVLIAFPHYRSGAKRLAWVPDQPRRWLLASATWT